MKTSWRQLLIFSQVASNYLARNPNETKLKYAIERIQSQLQSIQTRIQERLTEIEIDYCSVDERENILRDQNGQLQFTKENMKKRNQEQSALLDKEDIEIEPYFCTKVPEGLTTQEETAFLGLVIQTDSKLAAA